MKNWAVQYIHIRCTLSYSLNTENYRKIMHCQNTEKMGIFIATENEKSRLEALVLSYVVCFSDWP